MARAFCAQRARIHGARKPFQVRKGHPRPEFLSADLFHGRFPAQTVIPSSPFRLFSIPAPNLDCLLLILTVLVFFFFWYFSVTVLVFFMVFFTWSFSRFDRQRGATLCQ